ncbi:hypothetical protein [uncultured Nostoc sp.]|uniref:hypothetical protein n=1 Tax=uncultured Nostoc sp. TaxID=340711 RepID=UPI0035CA806E
MLDSSSQYGQRESASSAQGDNGNDKNYFPPPPATSLPKVSGAIAGMGEKFAANPFTGKNSLLSIPIPSCGDFAPKYVIVLRFGRGE